MEEFYSRTLGLGQLEPSTSGFFTRQNTSEFIQDGDASSSGRSDSSNLASRHKIHQAKSVLAEALHGGYFTRCPGSSPVLNAGSMGPTFGLLSSSVHAGDQDKARACVDTLGFLVLDPANRKVAEALDGIGVVLSVLRGFVLDESFSSGILGALIGMVKHDDVDKVREMPIHLPWPGHIQVCFVEVLNSSQARLWHHKNREVLIGLIEPRQPRWLLIQLLSCIKNTAFAAESRTSASRRLLEPLLIGAVSSLLHPTATDPEVLKRALWFLCHASECAQPSDLAPWHSAAFKLVPLLTSPSPTSSPTGSSSGLSARSGALGVRPSASCKRLSEYGSGPEPPAWSATAAALQPLINLSETPEFHNALFASGCISPALALLTHSGTSQPVRVAAICLVANLSDSTLSRQQLSRERPLQAMAGALRSSRCCPEATVGLLYILGRLALGAPRVGGVLRQCGTVQALRRAAARCPGDEDVGQGVTQLLTLLGCNSNQQASISTEEQIEQSGRINSLNLDVLPIVIRPPTSEASLSRVAGAGGIALAASGRGFVMTSMQHDIAA